MALKALNKQNVEKPTLPIKILQFGEGNFLRAFVDWQIDKANEAGIMNHGVAIVQPIDKGMAGIAAAGWQSAAPEPEPKLTGRESCS